MNKLLLSIGVVLVVVGLALQFLQTEPVPEAPSADPLSLRYTSAGPVLGFASDADTFAWLGIPYAAPPVGELRWRAPRLPEPWAEPRPALTHGAVCPQYGSALAATEAGRRGALIGAEDCLSLDVYAPRRDPQSEPLPVMFWIHGGGNSIGTGSTYDGSKLAAEQGVVVVSINYRLGVLGWLSHPALRKNASDLREASGNFSNLDMIAALEWVQNNIREFGGDPDQVTIFGESAGGRNVFALLAMPLAEGLFHRAIAQSGIPGSTILSRAENYRDDPRPKARLSSRELVLQWLQTAGLASNPVDAREIQDSLDAGELAAFLRGLTLEQLFASLEVPGGMYRAPQHFRDGTVLPEDSLLAVLADPARWNQVPLITGTNRDEMKLFLAMNPEYVKRWFGVIPRIRDPEAYDWLAAYLSDRWKMLAVDEAATIIAGSGATAPVYAYRFDWDEGRSNLLADLPRMLGAAHALELDFIWGPLVSTFVPGLFTEENRPGREVLGKAMRDYWGAFAHSGDPGTGRGGELPAWSPWTAGAGQFMVLDSPAGGGVRLSDDLMTAERLKQRLRDDPRLADASTRCGMYVSLFLDNGGAEDFFATREYQALGCGEFPPWSLAERTR